MANHEKMMLRVRDGLENLHQEQPERERFSEAEIALSAWKLDPRYNFFESIRGRRRAVANGIRELLGREPKPQVAPHWFVLPGVERALHDLRIGEEPVVIREAVDPEGNVISDVKSYLNPPRIDGQRQPNRTLAAATDVGYRLAPRVMSPPEEQFAAMSANGNGAGPEELTTEVIRDGSGPHVM